MLEAGKEEEIDNRQNSLTKRREMCTFKMKGIVREASILVFLLVPPLRKMVMKMNQKGGAYIPSEE